MSIFLSDMFPNPEFFFFFSLQKSCCVKVMYQGLLQHFVSTTNAACARKQTRKIFELERFRNYVSLFAGASCSTPPPPPKAADIAHTKGEGELGEFARSEGDMATIERCTDGEIAMYACAQVSVR